MGLFNFFKPKKKGIDESTFNSSQYQNEILAFVQVKYFEHRQNYETVLAELEKQGLNNEQGYVVVENLKQLNSKMANEFQQELDSGRITEIKINPNPEHKRGRVDKDQVDKYIGYGAFQMDRGDLDNALELFDKAIELDDKATLAYANKGTLFLKRGDNEKALQFYNKALEIKPNHVLILENKMDLLFEMMNESNEIEFINTVKSILQNDPGHPNALIYIIQFYLKENNIESALKSVKILFANHHSENIAIQLLLDIFHKLPEDKALNEFETFKIILTDKAKYQLEYCKGLYLKGMGKYDEAINVYEQLNQLQEFSWNYYQMAIIKNLQNKTNEAIKLLKITFTLEPELKNDAKQFLQLQNLWGNIEFIEITK
ncbi:tetratricopeptide repeat protein [Ferruginibacter sp.]|nr:tetratricopeptide repeat protein [Ferruginibacter sp.]